MDSEIRNLVELLRQTFQKGAWHGPSVKEGLEGIPAEQAFNRLAGTHSIIELVAHMTAWRIYVVRKLAGDPEYKVTDDRNFPQATDWPETIRQLDVSQEQLLNALEKFPAGRLHQQVPGHKRQLTFYTLLHGIIHHDLYHTGQIILIKKSSLKQTL